ncbi:hypothetical protein [Paenibacillus plantarum]
MGKGDVFLILPDMEHSLQVTDNKEFEVITTDFLPKPVSE